MNTSVEASVTPQSSGDTANCRRAVSLESRATRSLVWAFTQAWGGKALTLLTYLALARWLDPTDVGLAASVALVLSFVGSIAEGGFGDALVQRKGLRNEDAELPFVTSIAMAVGFAIAIACLAPLLEEWMHAPGLATYLRVTALLVPVTTAGTFQEAFYKRSLDFRTLAVRQLIAVTLSACIAIALAMSGAGAWSLVAQAATYACVSAVWLWRRPLWRPRGHWAPASFSPLARFGVNVVGSRLLDWGSTRTVDLMVVTLFGAAGMGIYAMGAKLYQTAIELLWRAAMDVAFSVLSRVAHDRQRLASSYLDVTNFAAAISAPLFILMAALSKDITIVIFGQRWLASADVMLALMVLGSVQTVQFVNGSFLSASGKPHISMRITALKLIAVVSLLTLAHVSSIAQLTWLYVIAMSISTPFSFWAVIRDLSLDVREVCGRLLPPYVAAIASALIVFVLRPHLPGLPDFVRLVCLSAVYVGTYCIVVVMIFRKTAERFRLVFQSIKSKRA